MNSFHAKLTYRLICGLIVMGAASRVATGCPQDEVELPNHHCKCSNAHSTADNSWTMFCYSKIDKEERGPSPITLKNDTTIVSAQIPTSQNATQKPNTENNEKNNPLKKQRIASSKLPDGPAVKTHLVKVLHRSRRDAWGRVIEVHNEKNKIKPEFTLTHRPPLGPTKGELLIDCQNGGMEVAGIMKYFQVVDTELFVFKNCPLPKNVTFADIMSGTEWPVEYLNLIHVRLDSPILPKAPFLANAGVIKELQISDSTVEDFEEGFFVNFTKLSLLSLPGNKIHSIKELGVLHDLRELSLSGNPLGPLKEDTFKGLKSLEWLQIFKCGITSIDSKAFKELPQLVHLQMNDNGLRELPSGLFSNNSNLGTLILTRNRFNNGFPDDLLKNLFQFENFTCSDCQLPSLSENLFTSAPRLTRLRLVNNRIERLPKGIFSKNVRLEHLILLENDLVEVEKDLLPFSLLVFNVAYNNLTAVPEGLFQSSPNIQEIAFQGNFIEEVPLRLFDNLIHLTTLNLANNKLRSFASKTGFLKSLETINLAQNRLTSMPRLWVQILTHLTEFDLSYNEIRKARVYQFVSKNLHINLTNNPLETIDVTELNENYDMITKVDRFKQVIYEVSNTLKCDCNLLGFYKYIKNRNAAAVGVFKRSLLDCANGKRVLNLNESDFVCKLNYTQGCPDKCSCLHRSSDNATQVRCVGLDMTEFPELPRDVAEVDFQQNKLTRFPDISAYPQIYRVNLSDNLISDISSIISLAPISLQSVSLKNNLITEISKEVTSGEKTIDFQLELAGNKLTCNCKTIEMRKFLIRNIKYISDYSQLECDRLNSTEEARKLVDMLESDYCPDYTKQTATMIVIIVSAVAAFVVIFTVIYYKKRRSIIVYMYNHHYNIYIFLWGHETLEKHKQFDAFVSFSEQDHDVLDALLEELERVDPESGLPIFKLCIHERDWPAGCTIVYNIVNSVQNSRRTILVLSEHFINSVWLNVEFKAAFTEMMQDGSHKLIVIVKGELPSKDKIDKELQQMLENNTYLKWGNPNFWDNLRYSLPHKPQMMKAIDKTKAMLHKHGHPMNLIISGSRPASSNLARTAENLENERNRLKSQENQEAGGGGGSNNKVGDSSAAFINSAYVAVSTEDISVHCDSFKEQQNNKKTRVTSARHRPDSGVSRPPRKKELNDCHV